MDDVCVCSVLGTQLTWCNCGILPVELVADIAVFVLKRDVKLQPTNQPCQHCVVVLLQHGGEYIRRRLSATETTGRCSRRGV